MWKSPESSGLFLLHPRISTLYLLRVSKTAPFGGGWISASNRVTVDAVKYLLFMVESFQYSPNSGNNQFKKRSKSLILAPPLSQSLLPCQLGQHISSWRTTSTLGNRYPCRIG